MLRLLVSFERISFMVLSIRLDYSVIVKTSRFIVSITINLSSIHLGCSDVL